MEKLLKVNERNKKAKKNPEDNKGIPYINTGHFNLYTFKRILAEFAIGLIEVKIRLGENKVGHSPGKV